MLPSRRHRWRVVFLPVDEYRALRDRTRPPAPPPISTVDATLTRVDYELRLEGEALVGRALLTADVLRDGWARVAVPAGLLAREARLDGRRVALVEGPPPYVLLSRAGRASLALDIALPLASNAGADVITLPASPSPISRVSLQLPRTGVDLTVGGGFVAERGEADGESRWTVFGRPNQPLTLSWKRKIDDRRAEQPLRVRARVTELVGLGEESAQITASIRVPISAPPLVRGKAQDSLGAVLPGVTVEVSQGGRAVRSTVTDANGEYQFKVPIGEYGVAFSLWVRDGATSVRAVRDGMAVEVNATLRLGAVSATVTAAARLQEREIRDSGLGARVGAGFSRPMSLTTSCGRCCSTSA